MTYKWLNRFVQGVNRMKKRRKFKKSFKIVMTIVCVSIVSIGAYQFKDLIIKGENPPKATLSNVKDSKQVKQNDKPVKLDYDGDINEQLHILAKSDARVNQIIENQNRYPEEILRLLLKRPESIEFALAYLDDHKTVNDKVTLTNKNEVPKLYQWDPNWGYGKYGDNYMGITGCGPTVLSMAAIHLTKDTSLTPYKVAQLAESNGHYAQGQGTSWSLFNASDELIGVHSQQVSFNESAIKSVLSNGGLVTLSVGPGDFTSVGHFILLVGIADNGDFIIRDPNSVTNTEKTWSYDELASQTVNLWGLYV